MPDSASFVQLLVCRRLAAFKCARQWVFMENLPRTSLGKVEKHMLPIDMAACVNNY